MKVIARLGLGVGTLLSLGLLVTVAHAQETKGTAAAEAPAASASDPDIVRLKNGGLIRGFWVGFFLRRVPDEAYVEVISTSRRPPAARGLAISGSF